MSMLRVSVVARAIARRLQLEALIQQPAHHSGLPADRAVADPPQRDLNRRVGAEVRKHEGARSAQEPKRRPPVHQLRLRGEQVRPAPTLPLRAVCEARPFGRCPAAKNEHSLCESAGRRRGSITGLHCECGKDPLASTPAVVERRLIASGQGGSSLNRLSSQPLLLSASSHVKHARVREKCSNEEAEIRGGCAEACEEPLVAPGRVTQRLPQPSHSGAAPLRDVAAAWRLRVYLCV